MTDASLEAAGPCDVALLAELYRQSFVESAEAAVVGTPWSARSVAEILALPGAFGLIATEGGEPVGFLLARVLVEDCEILSLGVLPGRRRAGHGRRLLRGVAEAARRHGAQRLLLEVADSNATARAFYRAHGFLAVGRRRNYYLSKDGTATDAVVCALALAAESETS